MWFNFRKVCALLLLASSSLANDENDWLTKSWSSFNPPGSSDQTTDFDKAFNNFDVGFDGTPNTASSNKKNHIVLVNPFVSTFAAKSYPVKYVKSPKQFNQHPRPIKVFVKPQTSQRYTRPVYAPTYNHNGNHGVTNAQRKIIVQSQNPPNQQGYYQQNQQFNGQLQSAPYQYGLNPQPFKGSPQITPNQYGNYQQNQQAYRTIQNIPNQYGQIRPNQQFNGGHINTKNQLLPYAQQSKSFQPYRAANAHLGQYYNDPYYKHVKAAVDGNGRRPQNNGEPKNLHHTGEESSDEEPDEEGERKFHNNEEQENFTPEHEEYIPQNAPIYYQPTGKRVIDHNRIQNQIVYPRVNSDNIKIYPHAYGPLKNHINSLKINQGKTFSDENSDYPASKPARDDDDEEPDGHDIFDKQKSDFDSENANFKGNFNGFVRNHHPNAPLKESPRDYSQDDHSNSSDNDDFIPVKMYAQVRKTETTRHLPREAAAEDAETYDDFLNAPRLREAIKTSKAQTVYSEEGYEDNAYDHAGHLKHASNHQKHAGYLKDKEAAAGRYKDGSGSKYKDGGKSSEGHDLSKGKKWSVDEGNQDEFENEESFENKEGAHESKTNDLDEAGTEKKGVKKISFLPKSQKIKGSTNKLMMTADIEQTMVKDADDGGIMINTKSKHVTMNNDPITGTIKPKYVRLRPNYYWKRPKKTDIPEEVFNKTGISSPKNKTELKTIFKEKYATSQRRMRRDNSFQVPSLNFDDAFLSTKEIKEIAREKLGAALADLRHEKYPYYNKHNINKNSPLRYAESMSNIPYKTHRGSEFYDSRSNIHCDEVVSNIDPIPDRIKNKMPDSDMEEDDDEEEENENENEGHERKKRYIPIKILNRQKRDNFKQNSEQPRLRGLGDKIDCFKEKYFGSNPLDSPFFDEDEIDAPEPIDMPSDIFTPVMKTANLKNLKPVHDKPVYEKPVHNEPVYDKPVHDKPVYDKPVYDEPVHDKPVYDKPVYDKQVYDKPVYDKPVYDKPVYDKPKPLVFRAPIKSVTRLEPILASASFMKPIPVKQIIVPTTYKPYFNIPKAKKIQKISNLLTGESDKHVSKYRKNKFADNKALYGQSNKISLANVIFDKYTLSKDPQMRVYGDIIGTIKANLNSERNLSQTTPAPATFTPSFIPIHYETISRNRDISNIEKRTPPVLYQSFKSKEQINNPHTKITRNNHFLYQPYKIIRGNHIYTKKPISPILRPSLKKIMRPNIIAQASSPIISTVDLNGQPVKRSVNIKVYKDIGRKERQIPDFPENDDDVESDHTQESVTEETEIKEKKSSSSDKNGRFDKRRREPRYEDDDDDVQYKNHKKFYSPVTAKTSISPEELNVEYLLKSTEDSDHILDALKNSDNISTTESSQNVFVTENIKSEENDSSITNKTVEIKEEAKKTLQTPHRFQGYREASRSQIFDVSAFLPKIFVGGYTPVHNFSSKYSATVQPTPEDYILAIPINNINETRNDNVESDVTTKRYKNSESIRHTVEVHPSATIVPEVIITSRKPPSYVSTESIRIHKKDVEKSSEIKSTTSRPYRPRKRQRVRLATTTRVPTTTYSDDDYEYYTTKAPPKIRLASKRPTTPRREETTPRYISKVTTEPTTTEEITEYDTKHNTEQEDSSYNYDQTSNSDDESTSITESPDEDSSIWKSTSEYQSPTTTSTTTERYYERTTKPRRIKRPLVRSRAQFDKGNDNDDKHEVVSHKPRILEKTSKKRKTTVITNSKHYENNGNSVKKPRRKPKTNRKNTTTPRSSSDYEERTPPAEKRSDDEQLEIKETGRVVKPKEKYNEDRESESSEEFNSDEKDDSDDKKSEKLRQTPINEESRFEEDVEEEEVIQERPTPSDYSKKDFDFYHDPDLAKKVNRLTDSKKEDQHPVHSDVEVFRADFKTNRGPKHGGNYKKIPTVKKTRKRLDEAGELDDLNVGSELTEESLHGGNYRTAREEGPEAIQDQGISARVLNSFARLLPIITNTEKPLFEKDPGKRLYFFAKI